MRAVLLLALLAPISLHAATLRPMTTLTAPVVRLSDLFEDAGPLAPRVLGPAPAPGERIVVEARQLAAIARMFGVDWVPVSPGDVAVLERPGKVLARDAVLAALRAALVGVGAPQDGDIVLAGFEAPMIPAEATPQISVEQMDYSDAAGRFGAALLVTAEGMAPLRLRVAGHVEKMADVLVPTGSLHEGAVLRADDLRATRVRAAVLHGEAVRDPAQAVGMVLRHAATAGAPLLLADLLHPGTVAKNARVVMQIEVGSLTATVQGIALTGGAPGERIQVLNPASRMIVEGEVRPDGSVAVAPGSLPLPAGAQVAVR